MLTEPTRTEHGQNSGNDSGVGLPRGVSRSDWAKERDRVQNPSIRSFLGCIRLLEEVLDSNYAILHCSPERLLKIWRQVQQVCELMHSELSPRLKIPSIIPELEMARRHAYIAFQELAKSVISEIERYPERIPPAQRPEVRKLLCISIGRMHDFLRDTFGEIVASDPRSRHDADYFLSKRFAQDIDESEWLYSSVYALCDYLNGLEKFASAEFANLLVHLQREQMVPHKKAWERTAAVLEMLRNELTLKLREVLSLRGIRFDDMKTLEVFADGISHRCNSLLEVYRVGRDVIENVKAARGTTLEEREQSVKDLINCHEAISAPLIDLTSTLNALVRDLANYVPTWMANIENRRSLMLSKAPSEDASESETVVRATPGLTRFE